MSALLPSAAGLAARLHGRPLPSGGYLCRCPVPGHGNGRGDLRPSLSVSDGDYAVLVHCFAGCRSDDVLAELRHLGVAGPDVAREPRHAPPLRLVHPDPRVSELWASAAPVEGTLAERYLEHHRGLTSPFPASLRFAPAFLYPPSGLRLPAMVAAVQNAEGRVAAVQATYLRATDGSKAPVSTPRWTIGTLGIGAARMGAASAVLGLAEGVEDALAASAAAGTPCWASLGAHRLDKVAVPGAVREIHIFADDDDVGRAAADRAAARHRSSGRRVVIRLPPAPFKDWGDYAKTSQQGRVP